MNIKNKLIETFKKEKFQQKKVFIKVLKRKKTQSNQNYKHPILFLLHQELTRKNINKSITKFPNIIKNIKFI